MKRMLLVVAMILGALFFISSLAIAQGEAAKQEPGVSKEADQAHIIAVATEAAKAEGYTLEDVSIIYDQDGKLWSEKIGAIASEDKSPNFGVLKKGFLKNYRVVYFDYKEPLPDVWVFIDKDTNEVLTVYREEPAK